MAVDPYGRWWKRGGLRRGQVQYLDGLGRPITDEAKLARIRGLRIPPAWTDVRICTNPKAKLQAVGFDAKGRRQYIYHAEWVRAQSNAKYGKLLEFVQRLPHFREVTSAHLAQEGAGRERVLALVSRLINEACFRIGGERYARENKSYGIATLCNRHLKVEPTVLRFSFRGKRGVMHQKVVGDPALVGMMKEVANLPGRRLFQYRRADGALAPVSGQDVNHYIKEILGPGFSAKDFRTWGGTLMAARILAAYGPAETQKLRKRNITNAIRGVSRYLGNTPAIARASYISPAVFTAYENGLTLKDFEPRRKRHVQLVQQGFTTEEVELMQLLANPTPVEKVTIALVPEGQPLVTVRPVKGLDGQAVNAS